MAERRDVVFRRIRGRIVPIRTKRQKKEFKTGAALLGGGATVGAVGGLTARTFLEASRRFESAKTKARRIALIKAGTISKRKAGEQLSLFGPRRGREKAKPFFRKARVFAARSKLAQASAFKVKAGALGLGSVLTATGLTLIQKSFNKQKTVTGEAGQEITSDIASAAVTVAFLAAGGKFGLRGRGASFFKKTRTGFRKAKTSISRKIRPPKSEKSGQFVFRGI